MRRLVLEITTYLSLSFAGMLTVFLAHGFFVVAHVYGLPLAIVLGVVFLILCLTFFVTPPFGLMLRFMYTRYPESKAALLAQRLRETMLNRLH